MNDQSHEQANGPFENRPQPLYVTLILDETGSMQDCKGAAIAGFNHYVASLRQEPAETRVTLTLFNSRKTEVRYQAAPVARVHDLDVETYRPNDTTPLYDAIGRTLTAARQEVPAGVRRLCVILTDGEENASKEFSRSQIFDMIKAYETRGGRSCIWVPIMMSGPPAKNSGSPNTIGSPSSKTTSVKRSSACHQRQRPSDDRESRQTARLSRVPPMPEGHNTRL